MRYLLLIYTDESTYASMDESQTQADMAQWWEYDSAIKGAGASSMTFWTAASAPRLCRSSVRASARRAQPLAGALFAVDPGVRGLPVLDFAG